MSARCEIDLSPGGFTRPRNGPPAHVASATARVSIEASPVDQFEKAILSLELATHVRMAATIAASNLSSNRPLVHPKSAMDVPATRKRAIF